MKEKHILQNVFEETGHEVVPHWEYSLGNHSVTVRFRANPPSPGQFMAEVISIVRRMEKRDEIFGLLEEALKHAEFEGTKFNFPTIHFFWGNQDRPIL